jgi:hypothetical protein
VNIWIEVLLGLAGLAATYLYTVIARAEWGEYIGRHR